MQQHDTDTRPCRRNRNVPKTEYCAKKSHLVYEGVCVYVSVQALTVYAHQISWMTKTVRTLLRNKNTAFRPAEVCSTVQANPEMGMRQGKLDYTNTIEDNLCSNNLSQNITTNPDLMVMLCWQRSWTAYSPANKNNNNKITHTSGQHLLHLYSGGAWPDISSSEPQKSSRAWMCQ